MADVASSSLPSVTSGPRLSTSIAVVVTGIAVSGCGGGDTDSGASSAPTVTVTITETVSTTPSEDQSATTVTESPAEGVLIPDEPMVLGPNDDGESVEVVLHKVSYPKPKAGDTVARDRVLVAVEMTIRNVSDDSVYGTNVYPDFETSEGQLISDTGWVVAAYGKYGTGDFSEELPDSVGSGQYLQGWSLYEIPPEPGMLVFPFGPGVFRVQVDPPA